MKQIFKSLILPHLDYCSQLWMPVDTKGIYKMEKLQRDFLKKIPEKRDLNYWEALSKLKMLSIQRRMERYRIIYSWKILEGLAPNCGLSEIKDSSNSRLGRKIFSDSHKLKGSKLIKQSFQTNGPQLFNTLPKSIRNLTKCSVDEFKSQLDQYLMTVPDEPQMDGLNPNASDDSGTIGRYSNSLLFQKRRCWGGPGLTSGA